MQRDKGAAMSKASKRQPVAEIGKVWQGADRGLLFTFSGADRRLESVIVIQGDDLKDVRTWRRMTTEEVQDFGNDHLSSGITIFAYFIK